MINNRLFPLVLCLLISGSSIFSQESAEIVGLFFKNSSLQLAGLSLEDGAVEKLGDGPISADGFTQGVSDYDPLNKRYFYAQGNPMRLFSVDALNGEVIQNPIIDNPNNAVAPITNFAYNWLNDTLYGLEYQYTNGQEELRLVSIDEASGAINIISEEPVAKTPFLSGNSDIDPVHRRYFFATNDKLYTVDLDTGELLHEATIQESFAGETQFFVNLTYNWLDNQIYGLHFRSIPSTDPFGFELNSELRLANIDPESGEVNLISEEPTSPDAFSMGDCDIDPAGDRYFYIRQNSLYIVALSTGEVLEIIPIENPEGAVAPIINMSFDDLAAGPPETLSMIMPTQNIEEESSIRLDAFVGPSASYKWSNGSTASFIEVTSPGNYVVEITRGDFVIEGTTEVKSEFSTGISNNISNEIRAFPNPTMGKIYLKGLQFGSKNPISYKLVSQDGKLVEQGFLSTNEFIFPEEISTQTGLFYLVLEGDKLRQRLPILLSK